MPDPNNTNNVRTDSTTGARIPTELDEPISELATGIINLIKSGSQWMVDSTFFNDDPHVWADALKERLQSTLSEPSNASLVRGRIGVVPFGLLSDSSSVGVAAEVSGLRDLNKDDLLVIFTRSSLSEDVDHFDLQLFRAAISKLELFEGKAVLLAPDIHTVYFWRKSLGLQDAPDNMPCSLR